MYNSKNKRNHKSTIIKNATCLFVLYIFFSGAIFLRNTTPYFTKKVFSATLSTDTLAPGSSEITPGAQIPSYDAISYTTASNTIITDLESQTYGNTSKNWSATNGTLTLQNSTAHGGVLGIGATYDAGNAWATFNPTLNMTKSFSFSASMKAVPNNSLNSIAQVGNWLGAYFVPVNTTFTQTTNTNNSGGTTVNAITGLANSFFLGRNYNYANAPLAVQMAQTNASGNQSDIGVANIDGKNSISASGESISITWMPTTVTTDHTTGILSLTVGSNPTITGVVTMQNSMQFGFSGGTGSKGSAMTIWSANFSAYKPTGNIGIQYLSSRTGETIPNQPASTIMTNVGDSIGMLAPGINTPNDNNTYDYTLPVIPGYTYTSMDSNSVTVNSANYGMVGILAPQQVHVIYNPLGQTVSFNWERATGTSLEALPVSVSYGVSGTIIDSTVVTDNLFSNTISLKNYAADLKTVVPTGYNITKISNGSTTVSGDTTDGTLTTFSEQNPVIGVTDTQNTYAITLSGLPQTATFNYGYIDTAVNTPLVPSTISSSGTTGAIVNAPEGYNVNPQIPLGYYISAIYEGTASTGTKIASSSIVGNNAIFPIGQTYTANGNQYYLELSPNYDGTSIKSNEKTLTEPFSPMTSYFPASDITSSTDIDGADDDGLSYAVNGYNAIVNITGEQTNYWGDATKSLQLSIGTYVEKYYVLNYLGVQAYTNWLLSHSDGTVAQFLQTLDTTSLANDTVTSQTTIEVKDATAITTNNQHIIPSASSYNPVSDLVGAKNADGSSVEDIRTNPVVNGDEIGVLITDSSGTVLWVNNSKVSLPSNKFQEGTYTENYYALTAQGAADYTNWQATASPSANTVGDFINSGQATSSDYVTATTQLTVTNFILPFAGGSGNQFLYLMISLAAIGALGLYFSKRRKDEEFEFVPEQAGYGASTNTNGNKARFFQTLRKTRPYRKVFHSKNRIHLAQTQRKEGKMIKKIRGNST